MTKTKGNISYIEKLEHSRIGNPKYKIVIDEIAYETETNSGLAYSLSENEYGRVVELEYKTKRGKNIITNLKLN